MSESAEIQRLIHAFEAAIDGPLQDIALQQLRERREKEALRSSTPQVICELPRE